MVYYNLPWSVNHCRLQVLHSTTLINQNEKSVSLFNTQNTYFAFVRVMSLCILRNSSSLFYFTVTQEEIDRFEEQNNIKERARKVHDNSIAIRSNFHCKWHYKISRLYVNRNKVLKIPKEGIKH